MIPGGRFVVLGQPPLAADEGVKVIVRHVSIVGLALRAGEVLVVHQLRVGRDGPLQERIQIMLMAGDENIYADLVQPLRPTFLLKIPPFITIIIKKPTFFGKPVLESIRIEANVFQKTAFGSSSG